MNAATGDLCRRLTASGVWSSQLSLQVHRWYAAGATSQRLDRQRRVDQRRRGTYNNVVVHETLMNTIADRNVQGGPKAKAKGKGKTHITFI